MKLMKLSIVLVLFAFTICLCTACGRNKSFDERDNSLTVSPTYIYVEGDRIVYHDFDNLLKNSDMLVVATVNNAIETTARYFDDGRLSHIETRFGLKIDKILYGESKTDEIIITQSCGYDENHKQSICFSDMKPYEIGNKYLIFIYFDKEHDTYWTTGDFTGRYDYDSKYEEAVSEGNLDALAKLLTYY